MMTKKNTLNYVQGFAWFVREKKSTKLIFKKLKQYVFFLFRTIMWENEV